MSECQLPDILITQPSPGLMTNPLLQDCDLPPFHLIRAEHVEPAVRQVLDDNRARLRELLAATSEYTWDNLIHPLEEMESRLQRAWSPVRHLHSVADSPALRSAYNECLPLLTEYETELGQNEDLYQACTRIAAGAEFASLHTAQRKVIENMIRDFRLSGIGLPPAQKQAYGELVRQLSKLETRFEENLLDATQGWNLPVTDRARLAGLPESALAYARQNAERAGQDGWLFTLDFPSYLPVMQYADDRELRRQMYEAYVTRASDTGPGAGRWDNSGLMVEILSLRRQLAGLLGFDSYAGLSLARKMAPDPPAVIDFLEGLAEKSRPVARAEMEELREYARLQGESDPQAWDLTYYAERLRRSRYEISDEELRPYFPAPTVVQGMFRVVERLYGLTITPRDGVPAWHPDVTFYEIRDARGSLRGRFFLDLYTRQHKRGGAWMDECVVRKHYHDIERLPCAFLTCNFTPPVAADPALLTHTEVTTLFHEFGHGLHHMLTRIDYPAVAGINGVPWDAVELPSQFMENWCWEHESLDLVAGHYRTGARLPGALFERMREARNFHAGMQMVRQLEFALFDFHLHYDARVDNVQSIQDLVDSVRRQVAVVIPPKYNRFQHSFSHIFAGGYAAGYYSYKWAEVLSADAFSKFEENGIFDEATGHLFLHTILEQGGARDPMDLFVEFRGRQPSIDALLRHSGISTDTGVAA